MPYIKWKKYVNLCHFNFFLKYSLRGRMVSKSIEWTVENLIKLCWKSPFSFMGLLSLGFWRCVACGLSFTSPCLCNETYIDKMGLFLFIFVPNPSEVSYMMRFWGLVYGLQFVRTLIVAFELVCKDVWSGSQDLQCLMFSLSVAKSLKEMPACLLMR